MDPTNDELRASILLINQDGNVTLPARTLTMLISFALAGPTTDISIQRRDEAVKQANRCFLDSYRAVS